MEKNGIKKKRKIPLLFMPFCLLIGRAKGIARGFDIDKGRVNLLIFCKRRAIHGAAVHQEGSIFHFPVDGVFGANAAEQLEASIL